MADYELMSVDFELLLQALSSLTNLDDEEGDFSYTTGSARFANDPYLDARYADTVNQTFEKSISRAITYLCDTLYLVHHRSANIQDLPEILEGFDDETTQFIRISAWSFVMAWNLRYGGLYESIVENGLVKPSLHGPK